MARRTFLQTSAGLTGAALTVGQWAPALGAELSSGPKPIPGGVDFLGNGTVFHVGVPGPEFGHNEEPSLITDFKGTVGIARVQGTGVGTQQGKHAKYPFDVDMRFMDGLYVGVDGKQHQGTFALIWLDMFAGSLSPENQIHDFNPGVIPFPAGLFWTVAVPKTSLTVNLAAGTGRLTSDYVSLDDYTNFVNSITSDPPPIPEIDSRASYDVRWGGVITRVHRNNPAQGFSGDFVETNATITFAARQVVSPYFSYVADPPSVSPQTVVFAEIGHEVNGVFYTPWSSAGWEPDLMTAPTPGECSTETKRR